MMRRPVCGVMLLAALMSACSGADDESSNDASVASAPILDEDALAARPLTIDDVDDASRAVADALEKEHGEEGGFVALVSAFERGYDLGQISDAALRMAIDAVGRISRGGSPVEPTGSRLGVIALPDEPIAEPQGLVARPEESQPPPSARDLLDHLQADPEKNVTTAFAMTHIVIALATVGYSFDQIVEAMVVGEQPFRWTGNCPAIFESTSGVVTPAINRKDRHVADHECNEELIGDETDDGTSDGGAGAEVVEESTEAGSHEDDDGSIEDGTYTGTADESSEFGQFLLVDRGGVISTNFAEVVVEGGAVVSFDAELTGIGASNLNVVTGERLCENPITIRAELSDPSGVSASGNTAQVPVMFTFAQEVGLGSECFPESNVAFGDTWDDVATITFDGDTATATLTSGFSATMSS